MALSWNEIKDRAVKFSKEWKDTTNEEADAKPFLDAFFDVFGITRKKIGTFEHRVKKLSEADGYIDLLWKGTILVEMKSRGKNLDKAFQQALEYTHGLKDYELPQYILVSDFEIFRVYDTELQTTVEFKLKDLYKNVQCLGLVAGYKKKTFEDQDKANIEAAELMGKLHDRLEEIGYSGHALEVYLVRLLFCLFAEDTTIFERQQFQDYIEQRTSEDGSDLAGKIQELFQVLNTAKDKRFKNLDEQLNDFPYINGKLFEEVLPTASFDSKMRMALLNACRKDWSSISPAIFGSMFQSVMNPKERRNLGAHYTSEKNIMKVIKPLFLDELYQEFEKVSHDLTKLTHFHNKIANLRFLDPACGCGNFLIITYREIRKLELKIILELQKLNRRIHQMDFIDISLFFKVNVDKFYGIEYEEFPARIAEVAMWLIDHQMNMEANIETGERLVRIPLVKSARIVHGNALEINWESLLNEVNTIEIDAKDAEIIVRTKVSEPAAEYGTVKLIVDNYKIVDEFSETKPNTTFNYIIGNPPFIGKSNQNTNQKKDIEKIFFGVKGAGVLDYVACWYLKAAKLIQNTNTKVAFVSTNSIIQGEQVGVLWSLLFNIHKIKIHFAHRTFSWSNEAKGNAAVHVVIIGFANYDQDIKKIFEYENIKGDPSELKVKNINSYLIEGKDFTISKRTRPLCNFPEMNYGSMPNEGGYLLMNEEEKDLLLKRAPAAKKFVRQFVMGEELINSIPRYCLWLVDGEPYELREIKEISNRIDLVQKIRNNSTRSATQKLGLTPYLFGEIRQPKTPYIAIPRVSSVNRNFIPITILDSNVIAGDKVYTISSDSKYLFGILHSTMHMAWMRVTSGRLKSDYSYSNQLTYNNFPFPENPSEKHIKTIEEKAQQVLDVRASFPTSSLADLYNPLTMPPALVKAHNELDKAVDAAYSKQAFTSEAKRMEFLFELYEKYTAGLFAKEKKVKK
jgi:hypothetical protein